MGSTTEDGLVEVPRRRALQTWLLLLALLAATAMGALGVAVDEELVFTDSSPRPAWIILAVVQVLVLLALLVVTTRHQKRLHRANRLLLEEVHRGRAIQDISARLGRALTEEDVLAALLDDLPSAVGAEAVIVARCDEDDRLEVVRVRDEPTERPREVLDRAGPDTVVDRALRDGEPSWLRSPLDWRGDRTIDALAGSSMALAVLPLVDDEVRGVLAVAYPRVLVFVEERRQVLETIAVLAARALARGRRYDAEHRAAIAFQRAALPDAIPSVPGLTIAAQYRPATRLASVGGDWYDVLPLEDGRVVLVVGDVVGHGLVSAAAMGRLRTAFQTLAPLAADPGALATSISHQTLTIPNSMCTTVVCASLEPGTGRFRWTRAGHLPPILVSGDGTRVLSEVGSPPLGVAPDVAVPVHETTLAPGDRVLLVTDGVVERRHERIDEGMARLRIVAEDLDDLEPEDLVGALVEALVPIEEQTDDVVVLLVRYDGLDPEPEPPSPGPGRDGDQ